MTYEEELNLARVMQTAGASTEAILAALRAEGASLIESMKVIRELNGVRLGIAKEVVDNSETWADMRAKNQAFRESALEALLLDPDIALSEDLA